MSAPLSLDQLAANEQHWPFLADLLLTEQVPLDREVELERTHPKFGDWYRHLLAKLRATLSLSEEVPACQ